MQYLNLNLISFFDVISEDLFSIVYNKEQFAVKLSYHKLQQQQVTDLMQK